MSSSVWITFFYSERKVDTHKWLGTILEMFYYEVLGFLFTIEIHV